MTDAMSKAQLAAAIMADPRWAAVLARDAAADGSFYYSVATTGVYCRPTCASRRARPEHVRFHVSRVDAEQAGFRPCKRCKPDEDSLHARRAALITKACRIIDTSDVAPPLEQLAQHLGVSAHHFHRLFKRATGLTPRQYAAAGRERRVRDGLASGASVTAAMFEAGYNSAGRFYESADAALGMTPSAYRAGGTDTDIRFAIGQCSLGAILVAQSHRGVCAIFLGDDPAALARDLQDRFPRATLIGADGEFERIVAQVIGLIDAPQIG